MGTQTARQWMVTHEWMVKPMHQTEWIERQGVLVWLAEVFSALGTGLYLAAIFVNSWWGALLGWLIVLLLKLPLHLLYLGKPLRFWRTLPPFSGAWKTSWIARGVLFTTVFVAIGLVQLVTSHIITGTTLLTGQALSGLIVLDTAVKVLAGIFVILTGVYCGFMMSYCKSVPFWNTGLLPIVILNAGIADGLALVMGVGVFTSGMDFHAIESAIRITLGINAVLLATYLLNATYQSQIAEQSVRELVIGPLSIIFWVGIVACGIIIPLLISLASLLAGNGSIPLLLGAILCHTIGAFALKYCLLKVGVHKPIVLRTIIS
ncbi:MAG: NrfD/PsrC family molybdoenzyme membrane anchor subunit [Thermodesulfobacteriota bacterium]